MIIKKPHETLGGDYAPQTVFRWNSKVDQNMERSGLTYVQPITTKFCTRHDSHTVVACTNFLWSVEQIISQSTANFGQISNSIEISLVRLYITFPFNHIYSLDNLRTFFIQSRIQGYTCHVSISVTTCTVFAVNSVHSNTAISIKIEWIHLNIVWNLTGI